MRLYFDVCGMGLVADGPIMRERPVIVCLHGGPGSDHSELKHHLAPLADTAQVVFLDQRGQGRSDLSSDDKWNLDTWIEDVRAFCELLEIRRPIILGHSFGGVIALGVSIRYPDLPSKLIISSSNARFRLDRVLAMFEQLGGKHAQTTASRFYENPNEKNFNAFAATCLPLCNPRPVEPDLLSRSLLRPQVGLHFFASPDFGYDWFQELESITCPVLILGGELDPIATVLDQEEMAAAIHGAHFRLFPNAGHGVFRDNPTDAISVIRDFVLGDSKTS